MKGSISDLREDSFATDEWKEIRSRFADALARDRQISRETERVCFINNYLIFLKRLMLLAAVSLYKTS